MVFKRIGGAVAIDGISLFVVGGGGGGGAVSAFNEEFSINADWLYVVEFV